MSNRVDAVEKEKSFLKKVYDVLEWVDWSLVILSVAYFMYSTPEFTTMLEEMDSDLVSRVIGMLAQFPIRGASLYLLSLGVTMSAIFVAVMLKRSGVERSLFRVIWRSTAWGIWILVDLFFLLSALGLI